MAEIPRVHVLAAITPHNAGTGAETLAYTGLAETVDRYAPTNQQRAANVWESEPGSLQESAAAHELAYEYLLATAQRLIESHIGNRNLWAERYTQAAGELYGCPNQANARKLIANECQQLIGLQGNDTVSQEHLRFLISTYQSMLAQSPVPNSEQVKQEIEGEAVAIQQYGEAILSKYQPLFDLLGKYGDDDLTPTDLQELFSLARNWLQENDDPDWGKWAVVFNDNTSLSVAAGARKIKIGSRREAVSHEEARGLLAHELLVHALRAKNGYKSDNKSLATGLSDYLDAEEGLGVLAEMAVNGKLPPKVLDRYVDTAIALGTLDGVQRTRRQLFEISYARQLIRAQRNNANEAYIASLPARVWGHIDRIYRGGPGDTMGEVQAIFTKDIAYYNGLRQMAGYIGQQLILGKSPIQVFNFLTQAKFDPTNPQHLAHLAEAGVLV